MKPDTCRWMHKGLWERRFDQMREWLQHGRIKNQETFVDGFENLPQAFIGMLQGNNLGKMVVRA